MNARKLWIAAVACGCVFAALVATSAASASPRHAANTRVTIYPWPDGLFGYVKSAKTARCANHRRVVVFRQRGKRKHPRRDKRIASTRAKRNHGFYQWSVQTSRSGRFYAKARRKAGCRAAFSRSLNAGPRTAGTGTNAGTYPTCGPYIPESGAKVCRFAGLDATVESGFFDPPCSIGYTEQKCTGIAEGGPFPWGRAWNGRKPDVEVFWNWNQHRFTFVAFAPGQDEGAAHLGGSLPAPNSADFTIEDGFAQDDRGYPNGAHFYTPDLPGQKAGEVGGPLYLNFENSGAGHHARVRIDGYLYVKQ